MILLIKFLALLLLLLLLDFEADVGYGLGARRRHPKHGSSRWTDERQNSIGIFVSQLEWCISTVERFSGLNLEDYE